MSGGHFDYNQHKINDIAESIQSEIDKQGLEKTDDWHDEEWYKKYPEDRFNPTYSEKTNLIFKQAVKTLKEAYVYAQRIDWFLSGDDGEETFHKRIKEELSKLK